MDVQTRILLMSNNKQPIPYVRTNLPKEGFTFRSVRPVYWKVEVSAKEDGNGSLVDAKVLDYNPEDISSFNTQRLKGKIQLLRFETIDYDLFIEQVVHYDPKKLGGLFLRNSGKKADEARPANNDQESPDDANSVFSMYKRARKRKLHGGPVEREYEVKTRINFNDATIVDGGISCSAYIDERGHDLKILIENVHLRKEFDEIKEYLCKKLGKKTFLVNIFIKEADFEIVEIGIDSPEINEINESFFKTIKYRQIQSLTKELHKEKALHSLNELLARSQEVGGNVFGFSINDVIRIVTKEFTHRNSHQLRYLSTIHHVDEIVSLTLKPYFGFVFYCFQNNHHFYIWELLDSHATYVWSFSGVQYVRARAYDKIELAINEIQFQGRNFYKAEFDKRNNDFTFKAIEHTFEDTKEELDFETWKKNLHIFLDYI
jgi:hypothetical protein